MDKFITGQQILERYELQPFELERAVASGKLVPHAGSGLPIPVITSRQWAALQAAEEIYRQIVTRRLGPAEIIQHATIPPLQGGDLANKLDTTKMFEQVSGALRLRAVLKHLPTLAACEAALAEWRDLDGTDPGKIGYHRIPLEDCAKALEALKGGGEDLPAIPFRLPHESGGVDYIAPRTPDAMEAMLAAAYLEKQAKKLFAPTKEREIGFITQEKAANDFGIPRRTFQRLLKNPPSGFPLIDLKNSAIYESQLDWWKSEGEERYRPLLDASQPSGKRKLNRDKAEGEKKVVLRKNPHRTPEPYQEQLYDPAVIDTGGYKKQGRGHDGEGIDRDEEPLDFD